MTGRGLDFATARAVRGFTAYRFGWARLRQNVTHWACIRVSACQGLIGDSSQESVVVYRPLVCGLLRIYASINSYHFKASGSVTTLLITATSLLRSSSVNAVLFSILLISRKFRSGIIDEPRDVIIMIPC